MNRESIKRYKKNIRFFKKEHESIYNLLKNQSNEQIEIVDNKNCINVKINGKFLYPKDYYKDLDKRIEDFLNSSIDLFDIVTTKPSKYYKKPLHKKYLEKIASDFETFKKDEKILIKDKESLYFLIIYGVGLGFHIEKLLEKINIKNIILVEENIEFLIASLYTVDWEEIFKKSNIKIVLGKDHNKLANATVSYIRQINETYSYRVFFYIHYGSKNIKKFKNELKNLIFEENAKWGFFDDELESIKNTLINIKNRVPIYTGKSKIKNTLPLFIVASGPSLEYSLDFIKEYQNSAMVFSCGTALRPLLKNDILPDFEIVIERMKNTYDSLLENASVDELKNIKIIGVNPIYPDVFKLGKKNYMLPRFPDSGASFFFEYYNLPKLAFIAPTVTNMALEFGLHLGFKEIYLFGTDMGFKDKSRHHAKDSIYYKDRSEFETKTMEIYKELDGNFGGKVFSTMIYEMTRKFLEKSIESNPDAKVYNTSDGAKIEGAIPLKIEDIKIDTNVKKLDLIKEIESNFSNDLYTIDFEKHITHKIEDLYLFIDNLKEFILKNLIIYEEFSESKYFDTLSKIYEKFKKDIFYKNYIFFILFRGTFNHLISFHFVHISNLKDPILQLKLAKIFKKDLLDFLDEAKNRVKSFLNI